MANEKHDGSPGLGSWFVAGVAALLTWIGSSDSNGTGELTNPEVKFEWSDISARGVVLSGAGVLVFALLATVFLHPVFAHFEHAEAKKSPPPLPEFTHGVALPPEPRLQDSPRRDLQEFRAQENLQLHSYGMVDRASGKVTIPIDRAMDLLVERGIPAQKTPPANMFYEPRAGSGLTGLEGKVEPEPR